MDRQLLREVQEQGGMFYPMTSPFLGSAPLF